MYRQNKRDNCGLVKTIMDKSLRERIDREEHYWDNNNIELPSFIINKLNKKHYGSGKQTGGKSRGNNQDRRKHNND